MTEDEMVVWHYRLNGHGFGWTLGIGDGQGGLTCCGSWGGKESDMTERLKSLSITSYKPSYLIISNSAGGLLPETHWTMRYSLLTIFEDLFNSRGK